MPPHPVVLPRENPLGIAPVAADKVEAVGGQAIRFERNVGGCLGIGKRPFVIIPIVNIIRIADADSIAISTACV